MCSVTKEAYAIVLVTDTFKIRQDTSINRNNKIKEVKCK